jgi:hypothetical protein
MAKLISVDFKVGNIVYRLQGAKWFYNDADVRGKIGADSTDQSDLNADDVVTQKLTYQRKLVRMVASLKPAVVGTNSAQRNTSRQLRFWCRPDKVRTAMKDLPGKIIDPSLLPGSYKIANVFMPVDSNFS